MDESKSHWEDHPTYSVDEWKYEVNNGDTRRGYEDWCRAREEQDTDRPDCDSQDSCRTCGAPYAQFDDGYDGECPLCADRSAADEADRSIRIVVHEAFGNVAHGVSSHASADFRFVSTDRAEVLRQVARVAFYHWTLRVWGLKDGREISAPPVPATDAGIVEVYFGAAPGLLLRPPLKWRRYNLDIGAPRDVAVDLSGGPDVTRFTVCRHSAGGATAQGELEAVGGVAMPAADRHALETFVLRLTETGFPVHLPLFRELLTDCCVEVARLHGTKKRRSTRGKAAKKSPGAPSQYEVVVGNIGTVYDGMNRFEASKVYGEYRKQSRDNYGRAAGEPVTLFQDGEPKWEHKGTLITDEEEAS